MQIPPRFARRDDNWAARRQHRRALRLVLETSQSISKAIDTGARTSPHVQNTSGVSARCQRSLRLPALCASRLSQKCRKNSFSLRCYIHTRNGHLKTLRATRTLRAVPNALRSGVRRSMRQVRAPLVRHASPWRPSGADHSAFDTKTLNCMCCLSEWTDQGRQVVKSVADSRFLVATARLVRPG